MSRTSILAIASLLLLGGLVSTVQIPSSSSQPAAIALFGDSLSYGMSKFGRGILQGTFFTTLGPNTSGFVASNGGKTTTTFFNAARQAILNPAYSVIDFSLGGNNPTTAGAHYSQLAQLAAQNNKTLFLPVYNHVGGGFNTTASDASARRLAAQHPGTVKIIDYSQVPCFRALNGGDIHPGGACYRQMAEYRKGILEGADNTQCLKKTDITVGFRGLPDRCGSPGNSSDGVDAAVNNAGGKVFEHNQQAQALQYIQSQLSSKSDATITIVGHSAGANTAIKVAAELASKNVKVTRLVAADPSSGSAGRIPNNIVQAVGLISNSPSYKGVKISGASPTINLQRDVGHCEIDNLIEKAIPCVKCNGNKCTYTGTSICTTDASGKETCTTSPNLNTTTPTPQTTPQSFPQRLQSLMQNLRGGQQPTRSNNAPSGNTNNTRSSTSQCPTNYTQSTENGRIVCTKKNDEATKPQCLFIANEEKIKKGESVVLNWRTTNAKSVHIEGIGDNLPTNSRRSVKPEKTTTYKLTATGEGDNKNTCEVTISVEANTGSAGSASPKLSCTPSAVEKGKSGVIKWACPAVADSSAGTGVKTNGVLAGQATVSPEHTTEYEVTCLDNESEEIGKNICAITVGEPTYELLVQPSIARNGDRVRVSWASLFMKSCHVQGPRGFDYTRTQGVVITEPFNLDEDRVPNRNIRAAVYNIECESQFGGRVSKDVTVRFQE